MSGINLSLYDLADERIALDAILDMDEGEETPETLALAEELAGKLALKADAFGAYVRELELVATVCKAEEARFYARRKAADDRAAWLKRSALMSLQRMGYATVAGSLFSLAIQNNPPSVQVDVSADTLPDEYVRVVPALRAADKTAIAGALKSGIEVAGCSLVRTQSLRVK